MLAIRIFLAMKVAVMLMVLAPALAPALAHANARPTIASLPDKTVLVGETVRIRVVPRDADGHIPALRVLNPPSGSSFTDNRDGTRTFAWTPGAQDTGRLQVTFETADAKDSSLRSTRQLNLKVVASKNQNLAPTIEPLSDQQIVLGSRFDFRVRPVDPEGRIPSLSGIAMPAGASLDDNRDGSRQFRWKPTTAPTTLAVTFKAVDADDSSLFSTQTVTLKVVSAPGTPSTGNNKAPTIAPLQDQQIVLGSHFDFRVIPTDPEGRIPSLHVSPLPAGARFDDNRDGTRQFRWTPSTAPTTLRLTFKAIDAVDRNLFTTRTVTLKVSAAASGGGDYASGSDPWDTSPVQPETPTQSYPPPELAGGIPLESESKTDSSSVFSSHTSAGFEGQITGNKIEVSWQKDPDALGYNVYRQGKYVTTVWSNSYTESDIYDKDYYYEIQAFDHSKTHYYYVATGLTVAVRSTGRSDPSARKTDPDLLKDYTLIFADEFNGSSLDTSKWNTSFLWGDSIIINSELQYYVDIKNQPDFGFNPFTFDGNNLTINTIETPRELSHKAKGQPYLSGLITSYDALKFVYGYAETRAKVTFGRGYWPAFWLLNAYYGQGGDDPEIDIMEFIGHDQDVVYHTYHYYDDYGKLRSTKSQPTPGIDYTSDFHTFAVEWKPGVIIYFVDGIEVHRVTSSKVSQQSMYVLANTAMGGWWAGNPDESTPFPGSYMIDYIRVYQRVTPFDDIMLNDDMTELPYADEIPGSAIPNKRPTFEQWPEGYPHGQ